MTYKQTYSAGCREYGGFGVEILIWAAVAAAYIALFAVQTPDYSEYLEPWISAIADSDGLAIFATDFSNYTGFYITLMAAFAWMRDISGELAAIKAIAVTGSLLCAFAVSMLAADLGATRRALGLIFPAFLLLPTVMLNGIAFGQADAWYAAFALFSLAFVLRGQLMLAVLMFSLAFSLKLQAVFFGPFMLGVLLVRPRKVLLLALVPVVYFASNVLLLVSGRPIAEIAMIYPDQFGYFHAFSLNAPNLYAYVDILRNAGFLEIPESQVNTISFFLTVAAMIVGLAVAWYVRRQIRAGAKSEQLVLLALFTVFLVPFILPKMHDRYFFMAECLMFVLACRQRRWLLPMSVMQISVAVAYMKFHDPLFLIGPRSGAFLLAIAVLAMCFVFRTVVVRALHTGAGLSLSSNTT